MMVLGLTLARRVVVITPLMLVPVPQALLGSLPWFRCAGLFEGFVMSVKIFVIKVLLLRALNGKNNCLFLQRSVVCPYFEM